MKSNKFKRIIYTFPIWDPALPIPIRVLRSSGGAQWGHNVLIPDQTTPFDVYILFFKTYLMLLIVIVFEQVKLVYVKESNGESASNKKPFTKTSR